MKSKADNKTGSTGSIVLEDYGIVYLFGEIDSAIAKEVTTNIIKINTALQTDMIQLIINSEGGEINSGFAIIDIMQWSSIPVHTVGMGEICSAALMVMMAGAKGTRTVTHNTSILSHRYSWGKEGKHDELIAVRRQEDLTHERIVEHYILHSNFNSQKALEKLLLGKSDYWMDGKEAKKYGLIDIVLKR